MSNSSLFSKANLALVKAPLGLKNPVTVLVLGICSSLAVTAKLKPALVMGISVTVVTAMSNLVLSLLRKTIPNRIRIIVQLVVVAALVILIDELLKAYVPDVSQAALGFCGADNNELYHNGSYRGICVEPRPLALVFGWIGQWLGVWYDFVRGCLCA